MPLTVYRDVAMNMFHLNTARVCQKDTLSAESNLDMFAIGIETERPTSKPIPIPIPIAIPMIPQRSDAKTIHTSEHSFGTGFRLPLMNFQKRLPRILWQSAICVSNCADRKTAYRS